MLAFNPATEQVAYMLAALCFIFGLKKLSGVRTARQGNIWAATGMGVAIVISLVLLLKAGAITWWALLGGVALGSVIGVKLTGNRPVPSC